MKRIIDQPEERGPVARFFFFFHVEKREEIPGQFVNLPGENLKRGKHHPKKIRFSLFISKKFVLFPPKKKNNTIS